MGPVGRSVSLVGPRFLGAGNGGKRVEMKGAD